MIVWESRDVEIKHFYIQIIIYHFSLTENFGKTTYPTEPQIQNRQLNKILGNTTPKIKKVNDKPNKCNFLRF